MKFYLIRKGAIDPKEHHIVIPFNYVNDQLTYIHCLVNFTENELNEIEPILYEDIDFKIWKPFYFEIEFWNYLKLKHSFEVTVNYSDEPLGINSFEFDENDLMYMKLMDWIP